MVITVSVPASAPKFESASYIRNIPETRNIGVSIITVKATGDNSVVYSIVDSDESFTINQGTGEVTNVRSLDFETLKRHLFCVSAKDSKTGLIDVTKVTVTLSNVNDEPPHYTGNFSLSVSASWPINIGLIDPVTSEGIDVNYTFAEPYDGFAINPEFSTITLSKTKPAGVYPLKVIAQNNFGTASTFVFVTLQSGGFTPAAIDDVESTSPGTLKMTVGLEKYFPAGIDSGDGTSFTVYVQEGGKFTIPIFPCLFIFLP